MRGSRSSVTVGICVLAAAAVEFVVTEVITTSGWSTLLYVHSGPPAAAAGAWLCGALVLGQETCSSLHSVADIGFVLQGILFGVAAALLARMLPGRVRRPLALLAPAYSFGMVVLGLVPVSTETTADGTVWWHYLGGFLAIAAVNAAAVMVGRHIFRERHPRALGAIDVTFGVLGLMCLLSLAALPANAADRLLELGAVSAVVDAEFATALALGYVALAGAVPRRRRDGPPRPFST